MMRLAWGFVLYVAAIWGEAAWREVTGHLGLACDRAAGGCGDA